MGALCLPVGLVVGLLVGSDAIGDGWEYFFCYTTAAAFLAPALIWRLLVEKRRKMGTLRYLLAGALSAAAAHYLSWYFMIIGENVDYWLLGGPGSSLGNAPIDPLNGVWGAMVYSLYSYVFWGWLTLPAGALIGLFVGRRRNPASST
jgi:hypothetical protein